MPYSIHVVSQGNDNEFLFNENLGSASYLLAFWVRYCDSSFKLLSNILSLSDSDVGFVITPNLFESFSNELNELEERWENKFSHADDAELLNGLLEKSNLFKKAISLASSKNLNIEVW